MQDQIVLLEQRKEVTTFLLDDGDVTSKDVVTETGQSIGYDYTDKLYIPLKFFYIHLHLLIG